MTVVPDAGRLSETAMQQIAREFNQSAACWHWGSPAPGSRRELAAACWRCTSLVSRDVWHRSECRKRLQHLAGRASISPLAYQLVAQGLAHDASMLRIEQGDAMGRPSVLQVHVAGSAVTVSGRCVVSGSGRLRVE